MKFKILDPSYSTFVTRPARSAQKQISIVLACDRQSFHGAMKDLAGQAGILRFVFESFSNSSKRRTLRRYFLAGLPCLKRLRLGSMPDDFALDQVNHLFCNVGE